MIPGGSTALYHNNTIIKTEKIEKVEKIEINTNTTNSTAISNLSVTKNSTKTLYHETVETLFNLAKQANDEGEYFPVFTTALGFEQMLEIQCTTVERNVLNLVNRSKTIKFFDSGSVMSRMFSRIP